MAMIDGMPDREAVAPPQKLLWKQRGVVGAVSALVIGVYAVCAHSGFWESLSLNPAESYYNLLVEGFRAGQLSLNKAPPAGLMQLANPYDGVANAHYRGAFYQLHDLSYYKGRLYLYFGITPAVILFWPFVSLTGHYLYQRQAVEIFCVVGYLAGAGVLCALWRRYFSEVSVWVLAAGALGLGLASGIPMLLSRCSVYEVPISCGYMLTMIALGAIWSALHSSQRSCRWLAMASAAYGLALGARPSLLYGAVILLVPVAQSWRERRTVLAPLLAAMVPIALIGVGLMLYNVLRFDSPFEFGVRYQLGGEQHLTKQFFSPRYLWLNFRVYFLEPARWTGRFPYVRDIPLPALPVGHAPVERTFGVLTDIPLVWLALAVPLAWRTRSVQPRSVLCGFLAAVAALFGTAALTLGLCCYAVGRYEVDFLPALVLLAVIGILGLERRLADRPAWRRMARCGWALLLGFSVVFNLLSGVAHYAGAKRDLGMILMELGKVAEATDRFTEAVKLDPDYAAARNELGLALEQAGRTNEAIQQYEQAVRLEPDLAEAHYNLGNALVRTHHLEAAIRHYREALRLQPNHREPYCDLGDLLLAFGRFQEAITQYEQALRIDPDYAEAHDRLGNALARTGKVEGAIAHFEQALRIKPDYAEARNGLANALMLKGNLDEAIRQYQQALQVTPGSATTHYNLGVALERVGRTTDAIAQYEQALSLKPDLTVARDALSRLRGQ
jgi:tetratricopeptide (TPR) repeat protein